MNKETIKDIMNGVNITEKYEAENALNFVNNLIIAQLENSKVTDPEATGYRNRLGTAIEIISSLFNILDELDD